MSTVVQANSKLPGFLSLLLVIALGASLAKLMWLVLTPPQKLNIQNLNNDGAVISQKAKVNYGKLIADQHIFGEVKKKPVETVTKPVVPVKQVVAPTKLNLKLHGIVAYKSKEGYALISSGGGQQKVYSKGEAIQEGVTVSDILPDKVVLNNRGQTEDLLLPVDESSAKTKPKRAGSSFNANLPNDAPPRNEGRSLLPNGNAQNGAPDLGAFREQVIQNPSKLMDIVRPSPAIVDGQFIGYRIQPGSKRKLFRELSFRPNDIITEVNGITLDEASKGTMVLGELAQAADISVKVKRGDQELYIQHTF